MPEEVVQYILGRYPRDMRSLFDLLDRIDRASLVQQRVVIPFFPRLEEADGGQIGSVLMIKSFLQHCD